MTRKARCGKTQKHTKMPGDATPWEELSRDIKKNIRSNSGPSVNKNEKEMHPIKKPENKFSPATEKDSFSEYSLNKTKTKDDTFLKNNVFDKEKQQRLSPHQERKIYKYEKKLQKRCIPPDTIEDVIGKKRRTEEISLNKTFTTRACFNCGERGHLASDCPLPSGSATRVTSICFKCGSTDHVSRRCQKKVEGYPFAKCLVCKEQGHIDKYCPKNKRGRYIKEEDHPIRVYTINQGTSIDAEIVEDAPMTKKKMSKKFKIVKF